MNPTLTAALWMIGAIVSFSAMAVAGREAAAHLDTFEIMMYRSAIGIVLVSAILTMTRHWGDISTLHIRGHLRRNAVHFIGQNFWLVAVATAPLAQVFALEFTTPIWVILFSALLLGEALTRARTMAALVGFVGILIVARPSVDTISTGILSAAGAAVFFALTFIFTKQLTRRESVGAILFWMSVTQFLIGLVITGYDLHVRWPVAEVLPYLSVIAVAGFLAHFCLTNALAIAPAAVVAPFDFARLPAIAVVGMLLYDEPLDIWVVVGAVIILGANYLNVLTENRMNRIA